MLHLLCIEGAPAHDNTGGKCYFLLSPREIRDLVYRHLLLDEKHGIFPQYRSCLRSGNARPVYVGILGTCRQVYNEALPVLYGENLFRYKTRSDCEHRSKGLGVEVTNRNFSLIQKVELSFSPVYCCLKAKDFVKFIDHIKGLGCNLKTFHLSLCIQPEFARYRPETSDIAGSKEIATAMSDLPVQLSITISASDTEEENASMFRTLVHMICETKGWTVSVNRQWRVPKYQDTDEEVRRLKGLMWKVEEDVKAKKEGPFIYHRQWELSPKSKMEG